LDNCPPSRLVLVVKGGEGVVVVDGVLLDEPVAVFVDMESNGFHGVLSLCCV
jgi:hypothetical protein